MSQFTYSIRKNYNQYPSSHYSNQSFYVSALEKLDRLTNKYQPKKVTENERYKKLCHEGKCSLFEISSSMYRYYYINRETPNDILNDLIDYAMEVTHYTLDTEDQLQSPPKRSELALIQIEFIHENDPSILILIEAVHLPPEDSQTFKKINTLCRTIFSNNHCIYAWGDIKQELAKFYKYNLFNKNDIDQTKPKNIQDKFKEWFHENYPSSPYVQIKANETYSLQMAIYLTFNQWLDKRMTLADWGCGTDPILNTITVPKEFINKKNQIITDEKEYRRLMAIYALNDCLAVTQLAQKIKSRNSSATTTTCYEDVSDDEEIINHGNDQEPMNLSSFDDIEDHVEIYAPTEILTLNDDNMHSEPMGNILTGVHGQYELYEMISDNDIDDISLPEIIKLHLPSKQHHLNEPQERVHGPGKSLNEIEIISDDDIEQYTTTRPFQSQQSQQHQSLTRNQRKNRKKRARRYRFE
ncbi:unnamed protein product, partial [Rotaria sp. Silwood2]